MFVLNLLQTYVIGKCTLLLCTLNHSLVICIVALGEFSSFANNYQFDWCSTLIEIVDAPTSSYVITILERKVCVVAVCVCCGCLV